MNKIESQKIIEKLPEFIDLGKKMKLASDESLKKVYVQKNDYIAIIGYKILKDFARFTSHEDLTMDTIDYAEKPRIYLTGLKRRAVYRRASEAILREHNPNYNCATPDHQCMNCYNCYAYGGVIAIKNKTKAIKSRIKTTTSFSIQSDEEAIVDEEEFHNIVHTDLKMEQAPAGETKKPSLYTMMLIRPGTVFPFIDVIFNPTQFDIAMYLETIKRADVAGYGSRSSLLGTMETRIIAITNNLKISQKDLLAKIKIDEHGSVEIGTLKKELESELVDGKMLEKLQNNLSDLIKKHKKEIYGSTA